jgi:hypothetical protein
MLIPSAPDDLVAIPLLELLDHRIDELIPAIGRGLLIDDRVHLLDRRRHTLLIARLKGEFGGHKSSQTQRRNLHGNEDALTLRGLARAH